MASYLAYPAYSPDGYPVSWEQKRLRFALKMNPSKGEIDLEDSDLVSFVPMDAVGEYGGIRLNEEKELSEVGSGYTYFRDDDVVVAKITPCFENGKGALATGLKNKTAFGTTELHVMRANCEQLEPQFLFYLTISDLFRKVGESEMYGAGGQKRVPESFFKNFRAGLPSVKEQQTIARFLDFKTAQIDALIAKKKALLDKLAEKRTALISHAVTKGLDPSVEMKDSGVAWLGKVPAHWHIMRIKNVATHNDESLDDRTDPDFEIEYVDISSVSLINGVEQSELMTFEKSPSRARRKVKDGDIIVSTVRTYLKAIAAISNPPSNMIVSTGFAVIRPKENFHSSFAGYLLQTTGFVGEVVANSVGVSYPAINPSDLVRIAAVVPPLDEQIAIAQILDKQVEQLNSHRQKIEDVISKLQEYRSALITNAVTGKIDVRGFPIPDHPEPQEAAHA